jgi:hypothetical protein
MISGKKATTACRDHRSKGLHHIVLDTGPCLIWGNKVLVSKDNKGLASKDLCVRPGNQNRKKKTKKNKVHK